MTKEEYEELTKDFRERRDKMFWKKNASYICGSDDVYDNIKEDARDNETTVEKEIWRLLNKQIRAIKSYVFYGIESEPIDTRCADASAFIEMLNNHIQKKKIDEVFGKKIKCPYCQTINEPQSEEICEDSDWAMACTKCNREFMVRQDKEEK